MFSRRRVTAIVVSMLAPLAMVGWSMPALAQSQGSVSFTAAPNAGPVPLTVTFIATVVCDCTPALDWDFGDGSAHATANQVTHTYQLPGAYTCILAVKDAYSGYPVGTATARILTWEPLSVIASQSPEQGPAPLSVSFSGQAFGGIPPYSFQWDFGDGSAKTAVQNPTHTYTAVGTYYPVLQAWDSQGAWASDTSLVTTVGSPGPLHGRVGVSSEGVFSLLDGPGIASAVVTAKNTSSGVTTQVAVVDGAYAFATLPNGTYSLTVTLTYTDHIPYDADLLALGCPAPSGGKVLKQVTSLPVTVTVSGASVNRDLAFPPPLAFLHGALDCYQKWYEPGEDPAFTAFWDNDARANGFISFTPNYQWWVDQATWPDRADEVLTELGADLSGLSSQTPPAVMVAHDMGGLVARVLTGGPHDGDPLVRRIRRLYLLGTPNSGSDFLLAGGTADYLNEAGIVGRFNAVYPSFGATEVYAIGGSGGPWGLTNTDGRVSLYSAFAISLDACSADAFGFPVCKTYPIQVFDSGEGHIFSYSHYELGSASSTGEILEGTILPWVQGLSSAQAAIAEISGDWPKSPVSASIWGTTTRTSSSGSQSVPPGYLVENSPLEIPLEVSKTDGMLVYGQVWAGSADFQVTGPGGQAIPVRTGSRPENEEPGFSYFITDPAPGTYMLQVSPGAEGVSFSYTAAEDSLFGIRGYLTQVAYAPGSTVLLRLDFDGLSSDVLPSVVAADILDSSGTLLATVPLYDDGQHQDGLAGDGFYGNTTPAPDAAGQYFIIFKAQGTNQGVPFARSDIDRLYVVSPPHLFTGAFSDDPADRDPRGYYTALAFVAGMDLQAGEKVVVSADLYDSKGLFVSHAASQAQGSGQGDDPVSLTFSITVAHCGQFGAPFQVRNLVAAQASTLLPLDVWPAPVLTGSYSSSGFACLPGVAQPVLSVSSPDSGIPGQSLAVYLSGVNFKPGASVKSDRDVAFTGVKWFSENLIYAVAGISSSAVPGPRAFTVENPDGTSATATGTFSVVAAEPPSVAILTPGDGDLISGITDVVATVTDQVQVKSVAFLLDGVQQVVLTAFPFTWALDTSSVPTGLHTIAARATDAAGLSGEASITVTMDPLAITSIQKAASPFRLKISGVNFQTQSTVFIGDDTAPWSNTVVKNSGLIVLKGGAALKAKFPSGVSVPVRVQNPDGASVTEMYTRP